MDIKSLYTSESHEQGAEMQVIGPDGKKLDCYITLVGTDSKRWREIVRTKMRKMLSDDTDDDSSELLASASIDWRGFESDGKELKFSKEAIASLFKNAPYISDQADRFIANRANFTKSSVKK